MILLDTNVVSALMRPSIPPAIAAFTRRQPLESMFLPSIVLAEIRYGLHCLPDGRRRIQLEQDFEMLLAAGFAERILVFDESCASSYAAVRTSRERAGRPVSMEDCLIGGMALAYGAVLATRNTTHFDGYGLTLLNPWEDG